MTVTLGTNQEMLVFEDLGEISCFTAGEDLVPGFVFLSGTNLTLFQAGALATYADRKPIGVVTGSYTSDDNPVGVRTRGVVRMIAASACSAGDSVYPSATAGRFNKTSTSASFAKSYGTVLTGAAESGVAWVKLSI